MPQTQQPQTNCPKPNPGDFGKDVFLNNQYGPASAVGSQYGVDPTLLLGLSALETGWGTSSMYVNQSNPFGATPGGDSTAGLSYPSYSAAWNSWGAMWGPRVYGVGSNVSAFTGALTQDNRGNPIESPPVRPLEAIERVMQMLVCDPERLRCRRKACKLGRCDHFG